MSHGRGQVHSDPPEGAVAGTERGRSPSGVPATAARKLRGFGRASWLRLKAILSQIRPRRPRRRMPRQAPVGPTPAGRPEAMTEPRAGRRGVTALDLTQTRPPRRYPWGEIRTAEDWWGDLDREAEERLQRWLHGDL